MNPNLLIFFKRSVYVLVFGALMAGLYYRLKDSEMVNWSDVGDYLAQGFLGFMVILIIVVFGGLMLRVVWTGIMNRVDSIELCCPDKKYEGVHIIASHYSPGGESSEGFSSYFHYYLDQRGKLYLSKKVEQEGRDLSKSIQHLSEQTRLPLEPDPSRGVKVGANTDGNDKATNVRMPVGKGELHFRGYEGLIDYGFKVTYTLGNQTQWRVTI